jgi:hypothetical protein
VVKAANLGVDGVRAGYEMGDISMKIGAGPTCLNSFPGFLNEAPALGCAAAVNCGLANQARSSVVSFIELFPYQSQRYLFWNVK